MITATLHRQKPLIRYCAFTQEQIEEQKQFVRDLKEDKANIMIEGSMLEIIAFLKGLRQICGKSP